MLGIFFIECSKSATALAWVIAILTVAYNVILPFSNSSYVLVTVQQNFTVFSVRKISDLFCISSCFSTGAVTNATVIPRPLYLDALPPKSCIRAIQPFKRHLHVPGQLSSNHTASHTESFELGLSSDGIPLVLSGKLSEVHMQILLTLLSSTISC